MAHGVGLPDPEYGWEVTGDVFSTNTRLSRKGGGMYTGYRFQRVIRCKRNYSLKVGAPCNRNFYRPQTKLRKGNVFYTCLSVILFTGEGWAVCLQAGIHPTPRQTPLSRYPPRQTPPCPVHAGIHTPCPVHAGIHTPPAQCMLG